MADEARCRVCDAYVDSLAMCVDDPTHDTGWRACPECGGDGVFEDPPGERVECWACGTAGVKKAGGW